MVPQDPEESSSEFMVSWRSLDSVSIVPSVVTYTDELAKGLNAKYQKYEMYKLEQSISYIVYIYIYIFRVHIFSIKIMALLQRTT